MSRSLFAILTIISTILFSTKVSACDDKSCESAYLASTERYVANHIRRANTLRAERLAYSKNRERRDYALYVHLHFLHAGRNHLKEI